MTNPNNAVGTNGAYGGRTSVNAFNDVAAAYTRGIMSGWGCAPDTGMSVSLGGDGNTRDVAIAEDNAGNKTTINNISGSPITVTLSAAPGSNTRIDAIVAYVDNPPQGNNTTSDNPTACGLIAVAGTPSASPSAPNDSAIRTAITADGASGTTAYYVVLATITVATGTTDITSDDITAGAFAQIGTNQIQNGAITSDKLDLTTLPIDYSTTEQDTFRKWIDGKEIYKKTVDWGTMPNNSRVDRTGLFPSGANVIWLEAMAVQATAPSGGTYGVHNLPYVSANGASFDTVFVSDKSAGQISLATNTDRSAWRAYITLYYTKSS